MQVCMLQTMLKIKTIIVSIQLLFLIKIVTAKSYLHLKNDRTAMIDTHCCMQINNDFIPFTLPKCGAKVRTTILKSDLFILFLLCSLIITTGFIRQFVEVRQNI